MKRKANNLIQSVGRSLDILEALAASDKKGVGVLELGRRLRLKPSTVHNLLKTLLARGYVEQDEETRKYGLGPKCFELIRSRTIKRELIEVARAPMRNLSMKIRESVVLAVLLNKERVTIAQVDCDRIIKVNTDLFTKGGEYTTVTGKVLLTYLEDDELRQFISAKGFPKEKWDNINSFDALHKEIEKIRKSGYAERHIKNEQASAVAAPIRDIRGRVIAALGVFLPSVRFKGIHRKEVIGSTRLAADEISQELRRIES